MAKKIKRYKVGIDSETYAISMVESPAIESDFVALSKEAEKRMFLASDERHMCYGAALIPDKDIYRNNGEQEFYISFTRESIEKMSQDFMKNYRQNEVTLDHEEMANDITITESWLVEDPYKDKANALGINVPQGTWMIGMKVNQIDVWERVKSGELKGFSVESMISLEDFTKQNSNNMNIETNEMFWDKLKNILKDTFSKKAESDVEPIDMEDLSGQSGFTSVEDYNREVNAINEELEENGTQEPAVEQITQEPQAAEEVEEGNGGENEPSSEGSGESESRLQDIAKLEELVGSLQHEIEALKTMNSGLEDKVKELSKEPSVKPVNTNAKPSGADSYSTWREQLRNMIG